MTIAIQSRCARGFVCTVAIALTVGIAAQRADAQERKAVNLAPARGLPFSDGIVAGNTLYVAGQEGTDDSGKLAAGGHWSRDNRGTR
jgi:enamine deaminase RidA (YjgF/YER057c/UK114 family)